MTVSVYVVCAGLMVIEMPEIILKRVGGGRPKGSKMPKVYKTTHTPIRVSYLKEFNERNNDDLETESQMRERLFK